MIAHCNAGRLEHCLLRGSGRDIMLRRWFSLVLVTCLPVPGVFAQNRFYVRAGAAGTGNGSDWNNAFIDLPSSLQRGAIYYVADGTYNRHTFNDAPSGTQKITVRKATVADHGTNTGWDNSYGDGQATFMGGISFSTDHYEIDGVTGGGPGQWRSNFGFRIKAGGSLCSNARCVSAEASYITVKHAHLEGGVSQNSRTAFTHGFKSTRGDHLTFSYGWLSNLSDEGFSTPEGLCEYVYFDKFYPWNGGSGCDSIHVNIVRNWLLTGDVTVRYNFFTYYEPTGLISIAGDVYHDCASCQQFSAYVYGNIFDTTQQGDAGGGGVIRGFSGRGEMNQFYVFNNSFMGNKYTAAPDSPTFHFNGPQSPLADSRWYNNVYAEGEVDYRPGSWRNNSYWDVSDAPFGEVGEQALSGLPWINELLGDFHLLASTAAGLDLTSYNATPLRGSASSADVHTFHIDMYGNVRGADGLWDRGAVEFISGPDIIPPVISAVSAQSVGATTATIVWTTSEVATSIVQYGLTASYGLAVTNAARVSSHSITLTGLSAGTLYHYRVRSADAAGNLGASGDLIFTTGTPDLTPPTVAISAPASQATVSNAITVTATATDNESGVASVSFHVDGISIGADPSSPYSVSWNTRVFSNGVHSITARAVDREGNPAESQAVIVTVQNTPQSGLTAGLVLHLPFDARMADETEGNVARDSSGNDNNARLSNGVTRVTGKLSGGVGFDGVNDFVRVPPSPSLDSTTNEITVAAWVNVQQNGQWQAVARKVLQEGAHVSPFSAYDLMIQDSAGTVRARMAVSRADGTRGTAYGSTALSYGVWYHLAGVYDGTVVQTYVNGALAGSAPFTGDIVRTGQPLLIGRNGIGGDILEGVVDDFRVYNRALSSAEIQALADAAAPTSPSNLRVATGN